MKLKEIRPWIFHVTMKTQYLLTMTFMRLQEYYESPYRNIRGRFFTVEEYMDIYAEKTGNFTYSSDWSGFNIPGVEVVNFFNIFKFDLTEKEKALEEKLYSVIKSGKKFYLIGTYEKDGVSDLSTIHHEIAHGYFYLNDEYKKEMTSLVSSFKFKNEFGNNILDIGYDRSVLVDEIQAYLSTSSMSYLKKRFPISKYKNFKVPREFKRTLDKFESLEK